MTVAEGVRLLSVSQRWLWLAIMVVSGALQAASLAWPIGGQPL